MTNQSYIQKFSALRALICYELLRISEEKLMKNQRYTWKIFPRCARQFDQNVIKVNFFKRIMTQFCQDLRKTRNTLFAAFFPKDIFFGSVWALSVGVCEMWTTWLCGPVAVPAHPPILAGGLFGTD